MCGPNLVRTDCFLAGHVYSINPLPSNKELSDFWNNVNAAMKLENFLVLGAQ